MTIDCPKALIVLLLSSPTISWANDLYIDPSSIHWSITQDGQDNKVLVPTLQAVMHT